MAKANATTLTFCFLPIHTVQLAHTSRFRDRSRILPGRVGMRSDTRILASVTPSTVESLGAPTPRAWRRERAQSGASDSSTHNSFSPHMDMLTLISGSAADTTYLRSIALSWGFLSSLAAHVTAQYSDMIRTSPSKKSIRPISATRRAPVQAYSADHNL